MWLIAIPISFLAVLFLLFLAVVAIRGQSRDNQPQSLLTADLALRVAASVAVLTLGSVTLKFVRDFLSENGYAAKLILAMGSQSSELAWPVAVVVSTFLIAMTTILICALWFIWHIVKQD